MKQYNDKKVKEVVECIMGCKKLPLKYMKSTNNLEIDSNGFLMYKHHGNNKLVILK